MFACIAGSGTYLRSIAHDLGQSLGTGAFLKRLRRIASGGFDLQLADTLERARRTRRKQGRISEALIRSRGLAARVSKRIVDNSYRRIYSAGTGFSSFAVSSCHGIEICQSRNCRTGNCLRSVKRNYPFISSDSCILS